MKQLSTKSDQQPVRSTLTSSRFSGSHAIAFYITSHLRTLAGNAGALNLSLSACHPLLYYSGNMRKKSENSNIQREIWRRTLKATLALYFIKSIYGCTIGWQDPTPKWWPTRLVTHSCTVTIPMLLKPALMSQLWPDMAYQATTVLCCFGKFQDDTDGRLWQGLQQRYIATVPIHIKRSHHGVLWNSN